MPRLTVTFDEDLYEWIEDEADQRDRSKAWIVTTAVEAARTDGTDDHRIGDHHTDADGTTGVEGDAPITADHRDGEPRTDDHHTEAALADAVDELRTVVGDLTERVAALEGDEERGTTDAEDDCEDDATEDDHAGDATVAAPDGGGVVEAAAVDRDHDSATDGDVAAGDTDGGGLRERIRAADWGSYSVTDDRVEAIAAAGRHLRDAGEAPMSDLADVADSAGGDTWGRLSDGPKGGRRKLLGTVLGQVGGDSGGRGASPWTWTGEDS